MKKRKYKIFIEISFICIMLVIICGILFLSSYFNLKQISIENNNDAKVLKIEEIDKIQEDLIEVAMFEPKSTFVGELTAYTGACPGCSGILACHPRTNVLESGVYFLDNEYGTVRIVAGDQIYPCGTIIKFKNIKMSDDDIIAVVMDRGGAIKGNIIDLLVETKEEANKKVGRMNNIEFEVLRYGW